LKLKAEALAARQAAEADLRRAEFLASKLDGLEVDLIGKAHTSGTLYAAITPAMIAAYLTKQGYTIEKSQIVLPTPIKEVGEYKATIKFRHGLEAEILVHVKEL
jgi:large subunit ribosomal protein L9